MDLIDMGISGFPFTGIISIIKGFILTNTTDVISSEILLLPIRILTNLSSVLV